MIITPAISLISAFLFSIIVSFSNYEFYYLLPIFFMLYLNKNNIFYIFKSLLFLNLFIVVLALVLVMQNKYEEALNIYIRTNMIILFNLVIFYNSKGYDIVRGLYILKFPDSFISTTYFTLKMIENFKNNFLNIKKTLTSRGFKAKTNLFTYYTFGNILGMLFVKSIRKSQSLQESFEARGFKKKIYLNDKFKTTNKDIILLLFIGIIIILKVIL